METAMQIAAYTSTVNPFNHLAQRCHAYLLANFAASLSEASIPRRGATGPQMAEQLAESLGEYLRQ